MEIVRDLWRFLTKRKNIWVVPVVLFLLLFALLIIVSSSPTATSLIYAIF